MSQKLSDLGNLLLLYLFFVREPSCFRRRGGGCAMTLWPVVCPLPLITCFSTLLVRFVLPSWFITSPVLPCVFSSPYFSSFLFPSLPFTPFCGSRSVGSLKLRKRIYRRMPAARGFRTMHP